MKRFFLEIAYDGTHYHGWQFQPNNISIQQRVNEALQKLLQEPINCVGCGRTDRGVHAKQYFLHFNCQNELPENFLFKLNCVLPEDIAVYHCFPSNLHARYDAKLRSYKYYFHLSKHPFIKRHSYKLITNEIDINLMQQAAEMLPNYQDFKSLAKHNPDVKHTLCQIFKAEIIEFEDLRFYFHFSANRFLHNMVRRTMGTLVQIGRRKLSLNEFDETMLSVGEFKIKALAPANGLFLDAVEYDFGANQ